jgi:hypothetical protein
LRTSPVIAGEIAFMSAGFEATFTARAVIIRTGVEVSFVTASRRPMGVNARK